MNLNLQKYRCMVFFFTPTDKVLQLEEEAIKHKWVSDASVFSFFFFFFISSFAFLVKVVEDFQWWL